MDIASLGFDVQTQSIKDATTDVRALGKEIDGLKTTSSTTNTGIKKGFDDSGKSIDGATKSSKTFGVGLGSLKTLALGAATAVSAIGVGKFIEIADEYKGMNAALQIAIGATGDLETAQDRLNTIASNSRVPLQDVVDSYRNIAPAIDAMGRSQDDAYRTTDLLGKALKTGGGHADGHKAAMLQLNQAIGSGVLRGDEFNSIMENGRGIAIQLAEGLGVPIGALRSMAEEGELTSEVVIDALLSQGETIDAVYSTLPVKSGEAWTLVKNSTLLAIGAIDEKWKVSEKWADTLVALSEYVGKFATAFSDAFAGINAEDGGFNKSSALGAILGGVLSGIVDTFVLFKDIVVGAFEWVSELFVANDELTTLGGLFQGIYNTLGPMIPYLTQFVGSILVFGTAAVGVSYMAGAFTAVKLAVLAMNTALMANPMVAAAAAIAAAGVLIYTHWDTITDLFTNGLDSVFTKMEAFISFIGTKMGQFYTKFKTPIDRVVGLLINFTPVGLIYKHWDGITDFFEDLWDDVAGIIEDAKDKVHGIWDGTVEFFGDMWGGVVNATSLAIDLMGDLFVYLDGLWDGLVSATEYAINKIAEYFGVDLDFEFPTIEDIYNGAAHMYEAFKNIGVGVVTAFKNGIVEVANGALGIVKDLFGGVVKNIDDVLVAGGETFIANTSAAVNKGVTEVMDNLGTVMQKESVATESVMSEVGRMLGRSVYEGVDEGIAPVATALSTVQKEAAEAATKIAEEVADAHRELALLTIELNEGATAADAAGLVMDGYSQSQADVKTATDAAIISVQAQIDALDDYEERLGDVTRENELLRIELDGGAVAANRAALETGLLSDEQIDAEMAANLLNGQLKDQIELSNDVAQKIYDQSEAQKIQNIQLTQGADAAEAYKLSLEGYTTAQADNAIATANNMEAQSEFHGALVDSITNASSFKEAFSNMGDWMKTWLKEKAAYFLANKLTLGVGVGGLTAATAGLDSLIDGVSDIPSMAQTAFEKIASFSSDWISTFVGDFGGMISSVIGSLGDVFGPMATTLLDTLSPAFDTISSIAKDMFGGVASFFGDSLGDEFSTLKSFMSDWIGELAGSFGGMFDSLIDGVKGLLGEAGDLIGNISGGDVAAAIGYGAVGYQAGGYISEAAGGNEGAGSIGGGIGSAAGSIIAPMLGLPPQVGALLGGLAGTAIGGAFGTSYEVVEGGYDLSYADDAISGQNFETSEKQKSFYRGTKSNTVYSELDTGVEATANRYFNDMNTHMVAAAESFGIVASDSVLDGFEVAETRIASEEEFGEFLADATADAYKMVYEELGPQMQGLVDDLVDIDTASTEEVNAAFEQIGEAAAFMLPTLDAMGLGLAGTGDAAAAAAVKLTESLGGVEVAMDKMDFFAREIVPSSVLMESALQDTTDEVAKFNLQMILAGQDTVNTRDGLYALTESLKEQRDAGLITEEQYIALTTAAIDNAEAVATLEDANIRSALVLGAVSDATTKLNLTFDAASPSAGLYADSLAEVMGGMDAMNAAHANYYDKFFSIEEKEQLVKVQAAAAVRSFNEALGLAGEAAIDTDGEFRAYVSSLDLQTEAGQAAHVAAMDMVDSMDLVADSGLTVDQIMADMPATMVDTFNQLTAQNAAAAEEAATVSQEISDDWIAVGEVMRAMNELNIISLEAQAAGMDTSTQAGQDNYDAIMDQIEALKAVDFEIDSTSTAMVAFEATLSGFSDGAEAMARRAVAAGDTIDQALTKAQAIQTIDDNFKLSQANASSSLGAQAIANYTASYNAANDSGIDGSHYSGIPHVPYDGYRALLHEGESVLTAQETKKLRLGGDIQSADVGGARPVDNSNNNAQELDAIRKELVASRKSNEMLSSQIVGYLGSINAASNEQNDTLKSNGKQTDRLNRKLARG